MKKNLLILTALLGCSLMAQAGDVELIEGVYTLEEASWTQDGSYKTISFTTPFDISGDWVLSLTLDINAASGTNQYGTALLATGTNPFAESYNGGFQLYVQGGTSNVNNTGNLVLKGGTGDISGSNNHFVGDKPLATSGTYTLDLTHVGTVLTVSVKSEDGQEIATQTWSNVTWAEGTTVSSFTTTVSDTQLTDGWTLPSGTLTLLPEPTTATLSLLALAGLAARRRRK